MFKESVKCVSRKFNEVLLSNLFCMDLIAATRAEGGLVFPYKGVRAVLSAISSLENGIDLIF